jgi:hypothetical protein
VRSFAGLIREPDWTDPENIHKLPDAPGCPSPGPDARTYLKQPRTGMSSRQQISAVHMAMVAHLLVDKTLRRAACEYPRRDYEKKNEARRSSSTR